MEIKIRIVRPGVTLPEKIQKGDWIDLRAAEDVHGATGEYKLIPLGVAMELPEGYEAIVAPRSSTYKLHGALLANSIGVIDESYKGNNDEWHFPALFMREGVVRKNERICQFRILKHQPELTFRVVPCLEGDNRGGFGSTGSV